MDQGQSPQTQGAPPVQQIQQMPAMHGVQPQPFVGYPQYAMKRINPVPVSRRWRIVKIALETFSLVSSIILYGLGLYLLSLGYSYGFSFEFAFVGAAAGLAIIWVTADFVAICVSREQRGIHPGAHVALHLIIWLLAAVTVGFLGFYISYSYGSDTGTSEYFAPTGFKILLIERTLLAFSCLLLLTHFILFVRACIETHQYNMYGSTVYVPIALPQAGGGYYAVAPQGPNGRDGVQMAPAPSLQPPVLPNQSAYFNGYYAPTAAQSSSDSKRVSMASSSTPPTAQHVAQPVSPVSAAGDR